MLPSCTEPYLIVRRAFDAGKLLAEFPPRFTEPRKQLVFRLSQPRNGPPKGPLVYARYRAMPLPEKVPEVVPNLEVREDVFGYEPAPKGVVDWTMNFADPHLFVAYAGALLAQDELQVLEHPILGSLREALLASKDPLDQPVTYEGDLPTPVLVSHVERRASFATDPDPLEWRPLGLYGNRFRRASDEAIRRATRVITPPTVSNLLAMAAPLGGSGRYTAGEIRDVVVNATTGFMAAAGESHRIIPAAATRVHTGHWGTGAFGGNRVLMAMLQLLAARLAGLEGVVYHTVDPEGTEAFEEGKRAFEGVVKGIGHVDDVLAAIDRMGFVWGESDGN